MTFSTGNGNALSIVDDAGVNPVEVTLSAIQGSISLGGITGLSFTTGDGSDDPTMVFTGMLADINTALEGMTFTPLAGFAGNAYLRIITDDQGNTGTGGALTDTDTIINRGHTGCDQRRTGQQSAWRTGHAAGYGPGVLRQQRQPDYPLR